MPRSLGFKFVVHLYLYFYCFLRYSFTRSDEIGLFIKRSIRHIDGTLTGTMILSSSVPRSKGNEGILHHPFIFRTVAFVKDAV